MIYYGLTAARPIHPKKRNAHIGLSEAERVGGTEELRRRDVIYIARPLLCPPIVSRELARTTDLREIRLSNLLSRK